MVTNLGEVRWYQELEVPLWWSRWNRFGHDQSIKEQKLGTGHVRTLKYHVHLLLVRISEQSEVRETSK